METWSGHFSALGVFLPRPRTPREAVNGKGVVAFEGLFAILPESKDCSYEPTKEELNKEGEGEAGEVDIAPAANGECCPLDRRRKLFILDGEKLDDPGIRVDIGEVEVEAGRDRL